MTIPAGPEQDKTRPLREMLKRLKAEVRKQRKRHQKVRREQYFWTKILASTEGDLAQALADLHKFRVSVENLPEASKLRGLHNVV